MYGTDTTKGIQLGGLGSGLSLKGVVEGWGEFKKDFLYMYNRFSARKLNERIKITKKRRYLEK